MIITCKECSRHYRVDHSNIKGNKAKARCKSCGNIIHILIPKPKEALPADAAAGIQESGYSPGKVDRIAQPAKTIAKIKNINFKTLNTRVFGLRAKIFLLFFFIPIILFVGSGALFIGQMSKLSGIISKKSSNVVTALAESIISEKAYAVAREVALYLNTHPTLTQENFLYDKRFMEVAVQKVGKTGYTVVNSAPTKNNPWKIRAHPKKNLIGSEILESIKARLNEKDFLQFKKLHDIAFNTQKISVGYYRFLDGKEKYLAMAPVKGTNYWVLSTTYLDEFTLPMQKLRDEVNLLTYSTIRIVVIILVATIVLVAFISFIYGLKLSNSIRVLTDVTNRFSVGEMSASINLKSKDEIGDLTEAITRLQESIRWAFKRLHRLRDG
jgi:predicted Zn finger-like uncharacterized protein